MRWLVMLLLGLPLAGCLMGTAETRSGGPGRDRVGAYPFLAVAADVHAVGAPEGHYRGATGAVRLLGLVSLPLDLVVDAILLPVDLVCWPCGFRKTG